MGRRKKSFFNRFIKIDVEFFLFKLLAFGANHLSLESLVSYGEKLGTLAYYLLKRRRIIALNNLRLALAREKSEQEIDKICRESLKNIGRDMMEIARFRKYDNHYLNHLVAIEGKDFLDKALDAKRGVIALTAHVGNFPLMILRLASEGYPLSLVARDPENPKVARVISTYKDIAGIESIPDKPRRVCVSRCLKALKENRVLLLLIDQNAPATESWVDFFGYLVPTFRGPAVFAVRKGAPIVPMFIIRNADHRHTMVVHPPLKLSTTENVQPDIDSNIARLTKIVEAVIREHPEQWWWIHRRFKRARDIQTGQSLFPRHS